MKALYSSAVKFITIALFFGFAQSGMAQDSTSVNIDKYDMRMMFDLMVSADIKGGDALIVAPILEKLRAAITDTTNGKHMNLTERERLVCQSIIVNRVQSLLDKIVPRKNGNPLSDKPRDTRKDVKDRK